MKRIVTIALALFVTLSFAQNERTLKVNKDTNLIEVVYYHDNGVISQTGTYTLAGKLQGEWLSFNEEGEKVALANYDNGKKVGKWIYWTGDTIKEVDYNANAIAGLKEMDAQGEQDF